MSDSPVNRIPSISQLMELRPLKDLAHKVSSSTVAAGIKAYLQPYQKLAMEAAPTLPYASLQSLASEISDWILGQRGLSRPEVINASGQILGSQFPVGPLADEIVVQAHARRHDYRLASAQQNFRQAIEQLLCEITGAQAAMVVKDRASAIYLVATTSTGGGVFVPRCQMSATFDGIDFPKLLEAADVQEIGSSNQVQLAEMANDLQGSARRLLWFDRTNFDGAGSAAIPSTREAIETLKSTGAAIWADLGIAGLTAEGLEPSLALCDARQAIDSGADLVTLGGGLLLGGPECGIIVGSQDAIAKLRSVSVAAYLGASAPAFAELEVCLRIHQSGERVDDRIPVLSLLSTPIENLDLRATRLAEQFVISPWIEEVTTREAEALVLPGGVKLPTRQVVIKPKADGKEALLAHLQGFPMVVAAEAGDGQLVLDVRTLFPRDDAQLVGKIVPENGSGEGCDAGNDEN
ncbi:hypothetical protein AB1L30_14555 [Bremerella sp. JC817]|uniref:hypothetical protein n=1 Tax=Bremerella sp. JC817 TaxID=3231756 RepID=UPI003458775D